MKWTILSVLFLTTVSSNGQATNPPLINLNTFKSIPEDMMGVGESFYLSAKDKKEQKFICTTDMETALIYINQKPVRLKSIDVTDFSKNKQIFTHDKYTLIIIEGPSKKVSDEYYTMSGELILKYDSKTVWSKNVKGDGGD